MNPESRKQEAGGRGRNAEVRGQKFLRISGFGLGLCAAAALVLHVFADVPGPVPAPRPVSFRNEVMAVLSKAGCNAGPCHGNQNGKASFKLSLRGEDPAWDHRAITRDMLARRVDAFAPEDRRRT